MDVDGYEDQFVLVFLSEITVSAKSQLLALLSLHVALRYIRYI